MTSIFHCLVIFDKNKKKDMSESCIVVTSEIFFSTCILFFWKYTNFISGNIWFENNIFEFFFYSSYKTIKNLYNYILFFLKYFITLTYFIFIKISVNIIYNFNLISVLYLSTLIFYQFNLLLLTILRNMQYYKNNMKKFSIFHLLLYHIHTIIFTIFNQLLVQ